MRVPHKSLIYPRRSTLPDMEKASAESVDLTTLAVFFDVQGSGLTGATWFLFKAGVVAHMRVPWNDASCFALANQASPKLTWVSWSVGILWKHKRTSLVSWASRRTALEICTWTSPSLAAMSGRVWVTANCRLPITPLSLLSSDSFTGESGVCLRGRLTSMAGMFRTYSCYEARMLLSGSCSTWIPVKTNLRCLNLSKR